MNNYKPKDDTAENANSMTEALVIKLDAHYQYIVPRINNKTQRLQAQNTFNVIKDYVTANGVISPEEIKALTFLVVDNKTHQNVLDTYEDIYYNMYKRYYGRSGDFYMEKM